MVKKFAYLVTVSSYINGFLWDLDKRILGYGYTCDPNSKVF